MELIITFIFVLGYIAIAMEHTLNINKAATALLVGIIMWTVLSFFGFEPTLTGTTGQHGLPGELSHHFGAIAGILFFLLGAMVIVEVIDAHDGFELITRRIAVTDS